MTKSTKCPVCGSADLNWGKIAEPHSFMPGDAKTLFAGYEPRAFVCLSCGFLGHSMSEERLQKIRERLTRPKQ